MGKFIIICNILKDLRYSAVVVTEGERGSDLLESYRIKSEKQKEKDIRKSLAEVAETNPLHHASHSVTGVGCLPRSPK